MVNHTMLATSCHDDFHVLKKYLGKVHSFIALCAYESMFCFKNDESRVFMHKIASSVLYCKHTSVVLLSAVYHIMSSFLCSQIWIWININLSATTIYSRRLYIFFMYSDLLSYTCSYHGLFHWGRFSELWLSWLVCGFEGGQALHAGFTIFCCRSN